jgi:hypothetical protein
MPFHAPEGSPKLLRKTITFDGTAGGGAAGTVAVATVTGRNLVRVLPAFCTTLLDTTGAATMSLGEATDVDAFIASTTATTIDANEWWVNGTPIAGSASPVQTDSGGAQTEQDWKVVSSNIILTIASADVSSGVIEFYIEWKPLSSGASLA